MEEESVVECRELVLVGAGEQGEIAYEYFTHDSPHKVVGFAVEPRFRGDQEELFGLPVIDLPEITERFPPDRFGAFVSVSSTHLNRVRGRLYRHVKALGYTCASYVSSHAFVWRDVVIGENSFIFENNVLQYGVSVGDNVILWSGNHVGHQTRIGDDVFISSHVVISGFCEIGRSSFLGVNCCFADYTKVADDCVVGAGAVVVKDTEPGGVYVGNPARRLESRDAYLAFKVPDDER
jgi:sugar O-acyltransferase (sialic acid O-acetyltransferase NeuD family)